MKISSGDAILVRTGRWARARSSGRGTSAERGGLHASVAPWVKERGVAFVGGDAAQDVVPSLVRAWSAGPHAVHHRDGINLLDNQDLEALGEMAARLNRWEFMLTIAPVPVTGGTDFR